MDEVRRERPTWDQYYLNMAGAVALRGDCRRRFVGCVLVDTDRRVIGTGYNGSEPGGPSCLKGECPRGQLSYEDLPSLSAYDGVGRCIALHAEVNALLFATRRAKGATAYINTEPCEQCTRALTTAGVVRAVWPGGEHRLQHGVQGRSIAA